MIIEELLPENIVLNIKKETVDICATCKGTGRQMYLSTTNGNVLEVPQHLVLSTCTVCLPVFNRRVSCILANIPKRFWGASLSDLGVEFKTENSDQFFKVLQYLENLDNNLQQGIGLHFQGPHGVAKTFLGCIILQKAIPHRRCYFSLLSDLVTLSFESRNNDEKKELLNDIISNTDLLMIDEVDKVAVSSSGQVVELVDTLFRKRYFAQKSLILTGNCLMEDIERIFGKSIGSMLTETTISIILTGKDFRRNLGDKLGI